MFNQSEVKLTTSGSQNDALMDSDLGVLKGNPTSTLSDSWIPKGSVALQVSLNAETYNILSKDVQFIPIQVAADKKVYVDFMINVAFSITLTSGATGTSSTTISFPDFEGVTPLAIHGSCSRDSNGSGYPVLCSIPAEENPDLNQITLGLWNAQGTAKTYTTKVYLTIYGQIENTDFGFGQLFPNVIIPSNES